MSWRTRIRIIAITGAMGTGKSTLAKLLTFHGFKVIQTDPLISVVLRRSDCQQTLQKLLRHQEVVDVQTLRTAIVKDPQILKDIEAIVHPAMAQHLGTLLAKLQQQPFVILEVPLLFEANWHRYVDTVCLLSSNRLLQVQRLQKRGGDTALLKILRTRQLPARAVSHRADAIIRSGLSQRQLLLQTIPALLASTPRPHKPKFPRW